MRKSKSYYIVIFIIITTTVISGILYTQIYKNVRNETIKNRKREINYVIDGVEKSIKVFIDGVLSDLRYLANSKHVINGSEFGKKIIDLFYRNHINPNGKNYIYAITRIDTNGTILYSVPNKEIIGQNVISQKHNKWALKHHKPIISDVFITIQGEKAIAVVYPVFQEQKFTGLISILVPFNYFATSFLQTLSLGKGTKSYLFERDGTILFSQDPDEVGENFHEVPECYQCETASDEIFRKSVSFFEMNKRNDDNASHAYVFVRDIRIPQNSWKIVVFVPQKTMFASINNLTQKFTYVAIFLFLSIILAFFGHLAHEHKLTSEILEKEHIFKVVADKTKHIAFEYDIQKDELKWFGNSKELLGYDLDEFNLQINKRDKFYGLVHPSDLKTLKNSLEIALKERKVHFEVEYRIRHKHGKYIYVHTEAGYLTDNKGNLYKMVGSIKDVTFKKIQEEELKRYKEQLEELVRDRTKELVTVLNKLREEIEERKAKEKELEFTKQKVEAANKLKSEFLAQMSHEIRTPINAIISYSSLLQVELEDKVDAEMKEAFQAISKAGDRIIRTVELILNMADLQTGSFEPHYQKWDVYNQILRRVFWEYAPKARSKGLALILEEPQGDTVTVADEFSLKHIFSNLIDNAIKYTDEGKVEIRTYRNENQKLVIEISDTGIGIDEEYLSSIFEPFSQEDHGYTRKFEGNGLGMALVKAYCDINNIDIKIETKKGVGTTFILTFTDPHGFEENNNQANQA